MFPLDDARGFWLVGSVSEDSGGSGLGRFGFFSLGGRRGDP
jgi:hypothetical protein